MPSFMEKAIKAKKPEAHGTKPEPGLLPRSASELPQCFCHPIITTHFIDRDSRKNSLSYLYIII